jgi:hypothetical protein
MLKLFSNGDKDFHFWPQSKIIKRHTPALSKGKLVFAPACLYPIKTLRAVSLPGELCDKPDWFELH